MTRWIDDPMDRFLELRSLLDRITSAKIGVVGDFCLDAYWQIDPVARERSVETGKETIAVRSQRYSLGGAGNVATNLAALGARRIHALGVTADDLFGREMIRQMRKLGIHIGGLILQDEGWQTPVYAKPYRRSVERNRIDFGRFNEPTRAVEKKLIATLRSEVSKLDAVIVNQQLPKSMFTPGVVRTLNDLARKSSDKIFLVDSRQRIPDFRSMICKLNATEAAALFGRNVRHNEQVSLSSLRTYAARFFRQFKKPVFITRGRLGLLLFDGKGAVEIPALKVRGRTDPVGAGDTVVAALTAALAAGASPAEAGALAMLAAAVTVQKIQQTGTATPKEILLLTKRFSGV
jgi:rfaE bifunctional protein kinase chain/domain